MKVSNYEAIYERPLTGNKALRLHLVRIIKGIANSVLKRIFKILLILHMFKAIRVSHLMRDTIAEGTNI